MKFFNTAIFSALSVIVLMLLIIWIIFVDIARYQHTQFFKLSQLNIVEKKKELLNHQANISAITAFFDASSHVNESEFTLFTNRLIDNENIIVTTLNPEFQWSFLAQTQLNDLTKIAMISHKVGTLPEIILPAHTVFITPLSQQDNPFLVYIIPDSTMQAMLDTSDSLCLKLISESKIVKNQYCETQQVHSFLFTTFTNSVFVAMNLFDKYYTIVSEKQSTLNENRDFIALMLVALLLGLITAFMVYLRVKSSQKSIQQRIENNSKLALLSSINHDIRTPINAVLAYSEMLKKTPSINQEQTKLIENVIWSANMLNSVAENTLSYSRAEAGLLKLHKTRVNFFDLMQRLADNYSSLKSKSGKTLDLHISPNAETFIHTDASVLFQLNTNINNNSFKYSTGASVKCYVSQHSSKKGHSVRVAIRDYGKGMGVNAKEVFKKPFTTAEEKNQLGGQSGIGVGLYTCKKIIDGVGGQILIRSKINQGTLVIFRFPYEVSDTKSVIDPDTLAGKTVFIIDDNALNLELCTQVLNELKLHVHTFDNEAAILEKIQNQQPDFVISDYQLIETTGLKVIEKCKHFSPNTQYFILSANNKNEIIGNGPDHGIEFLRKPFNSSEFLNQIRSLRIK